MTRRKKVTRRKLAIYQATQAVKTRSRSDWILATKQMIGCRHCKEDLNPTVLDWHHLEPTKKYKAISKLIRAGWRKLMTEMLKCDVLCANCHRIEEARLKGAVLKVKKKARRPVS